MTQRIPKWRDTRAMNDRLHLQRVQSDERIAATEALKPLAIPADKRVIGVATTSLPWHELRLDVTLTGGELIIRAGDPTTIYAMEQQAAAMMREAAQS